MTEMPSGLDRDSSELAGRSCSIYNEEIIDEHLL